MLSSRSSRVDTGNRKKLARGPGGREVHLQRQVQPPRPPLHVDQVSVPQNGWNKPSHTGCNVQGKGHTFSRVSVNSQGFGEFWNEALVLGGGVGGDKCRTFTTAGVSCKWTSSGDLSAAGLKIPSLKPRNHIDLNWGGRFQQTVWRAKAACQRWNYLWSHIWAETLELSNAGFIHRDSLL